MKVVGCVGERGGVVVEADIAVTRVDVLMLGNVRRTSRMLGTRSVMESLAALSVEAMTPSTLSSERTVRVRVYQIDVEVGLSFTSSPLLPLSSHSRIEKVIYLIYTHTPLWRLVILLSPHPLSLPPPSSNPIPLFVSHSLSTRH